MRAVPPSHIISSRSLFSFFSSAAHEQKRNGNNSINQQEESTLARLIEQRRHAANSIDCECICDMTVKQYLSDKAMRSAFVNTTTRQRKRCRILQRRTSSLSFPQNSRRMKTNTVILCLLLCSTAFARSWKDIEVLHGTTPHDPFDHFVIAAADNPLDTAAPTPNPTYTRFSTTSPTFQQSERPSMAPVTLLPTRQPTSHPSESPSEQPEKYPFNDPPLFPQPWYFNYDTRPDARFGPGHHGLVQTENGFVAAFKNNLWAEWEAPSGSDYYWNEFTDSGWGAWKGVLSSRMPSRNQCGRSGRQSPIDVRENGLGKCDETHEVRSLPGDFRLAGKSVHKEILPNKLRLRYERRPCGDWNDQACAEPDPPHADFPNGWGGFADVMHVVSLSRNAYYFLIIGLSSGRSSQQASLFSSGL